jgi:hypothetical protein
MLDAKRGALNFSWGDRGRCTLNDQVGYKGQARNLVLGSIHISVHVGVSKWDFSRPSNLTKSEC